MRPPYKAGAGGIHLLIVRTANWMSSNKDQIPPRFDRIHSQPHGFAQSTFDAIALYSVPDSTAH